MKNPIDMTALTSAVVAWVKANKPTAPESFYQVDSINDALPDLAEIVCEHVGYWDSPSEDAT
jgi:hypothetical protein